MIDHQLIHGDFLKKAHLIPDNAVDMVCTDPPYGTTANDWDSVIPLDPMWEQIKRVLKPNGVVVFTAQQPFTSALVMSNTKWFKQSLVWVKNKGTGHLNVSHRPMTQHEDIIIFCEGKGTYNPKKSTGHQPANAIPNSGPESDCYGSYNSTEYEGGNEDRHPTTLVEIPVMNNDGSDGKKINSTQKPVALTDRMIETYSNKGDVVLDIAYGSATTCASCIRLDRKFIGFEIRKSQHEKALERIKNLEPMQLSLI